MKLIDGIRTWINKKWEEFDKTPEWLITRKEWGARPPKEPPDLDLDFKPVNKPEYLPWPLEYVIIHSTLAYDDPGDDTQKILSTIREIQDDDMDDKDNDDIGYNFIVAGNGLVYEGRGWQDEGFHTFMYNDTSIGVALLGDFSEKPPKKEMIDITRKLIREGMEKGYLSEDVKIVTHKQMVEEAPCPAKALMNEMEMNNIFEPDRNWSEWYWIYSCKRFLEELPDIIYDTYHSSRRSLWRYWKHSFLRTCIMYIYHN